MEEVKRRIKEIEAEIIEITSDVYARYPLSDYVEALLKSRCDLLNRMFCTTVENIARFQTVNNYLRNLTQQAYKRLAEINSVEYYTASPDDDNEEVEAWVKFVFNDEDSVLKLEDDDYYGSNFTLMIKALAELYQLKGQNVSYTLVMGLIGLMMGKVGWTHLSTSGALRSRILLYATLSTTSPTTKHTPFLTSSA